jgi:hypothetical protein
MRCENCGGPMVPYMQRQRFCCHACSDEWFMEERRQAVEWFRAMGMVVQTKANNQEGQPMHFVEDPERTNAEEQRV